MLSPGAQEKGKGRLSHDVALKPSRFCGLSRTQFSCGQVMKSAAPLKEESVGVFESRVLPLRGRGGGLLGVGKG